MHTIRPLSAGAINLAIRASNAAFSFAFLLDFSFKRASTIVFVQLQQHDLQFCLLACLISPMQALEGQFVPSLCLGRSVHVSQQLVQNYILKTKKFPQPPNLPPLLPIMPQDHNHHLSSLSSSLLLLAGCLCQVCSPFLLHMAWNYFSRHNK